MFAEEVYSTICLWTVGLLSCRPNLISSTNPRAARRAPPVRVKRLVDWSLGRPMGAGFPAPGEPRPAAPTEMRRMHFQCAALDGEELSTAHDNIFVVNIFGDIPAPRNSRSREIRSAVSRVHRAVKRLSRGNGRTKKIGKIFPLR